MRLAELRGPDIAAILLLSIIGMAVFLAWVTRMWEAYQTRMTEEARERTEQARIAAKTAAPGTWTSKTTETREVPRE